MASRPPTGKEVTDTDASTTNHTDTNAEVEDTVDTTDSDLTKFQTNILLALRGCEEGRFDGAAPHGAIGLAIKSVLEDWYGDEVHHSRLYQNLDTLADDNLIEKAELDKRTNEYTLTDAGIRLISERLQRDIAAFKGDSRDEEGAA